jgi:hypothetical protein
MKTVEFVVVLYLSVIYTETVSFTSYKQNSQYVVQFQEHVILEKQFNEHKTSNVIFKKAKIGRNKNPESSSNTCKMKDMFIHFEFGKSILPLISHIDIGGALLPGLNSITSPSPRNLELGESFTTFKLFLPIFAFLYNDMVENFEFLFLFFCGLRLIIFKNHVIGHMTA